MSEPSVRFFHAENCNRFIKAGGMKFQFDPYEYIGGTWLGVYRAEKSNEVQALAELTKDKKTAVTEISKEEYDRCTKKKQQLQQSSGILQGRPVQADRSPMMPQSAPVVGEPNSGELPTPEPTTPAPLAKVEEALSVGLVVGEAGPVKESAPAPAPAPVTQGCDLE